MGDLVILLVVLLLFGAKRLPEMGSSIGKGIREFKRSISDTQDAIMSTDEQRNNLPPRLADQQPNRLRAQESRSGCRSKTAGSGRIVDQRPFPKCSEGPTQLRSLCHSSVTSPSSGS